MVDDFRPMVESRTRALQTVAPLSFRRLQGVIADVWDMRAAAGGGGYYIAPYPRIVVFLNDRPPPLSFRTREIGPEERDVQACYIPAGLPLWSRVEASGRLAHLDLHLEPVALDQRLARAGLRPDLDRPRMLRPDPNLLSLARLAADEVRSPRRGPMLLDGLLTALLAEIFALPETAADTTTGGLAPYQLAAVERFLRQNLSRHVSVAEMARVTGLSESWFAHAFKQSRAETPQKWQARIRIEAARHMMEDPGLSLLDIAHAAGFADQAHLSRQFRASFGLPPSAWRRQRLQGF